MSRHRLCIALATLCLILSWYYGLVIAPTGLAGADRAILQDLYGVWNGSRQLLVDRSSPYSAEVTARSQAAIYGEPLAGRSDQQFAYPAFAAFPLAPLALLPYRAAQVAAFWAFLILTALSTVWWRGSRAKSLLPVLLVVGAYPVIVALQLRQPTLLFAALIAAALAQVARSHLVFAGVVLAVATAKPQLALPVCVALLFWTAGNWRERRTLALSFGLSEVVLLAAATALVPGWFAQWLMVLRSYSAYAGQPLLVTFFGGAAGKSISTILALTIFAVCWLCREDLLFSVSFSIAALQLIAPFQIYNEVMLLAPLCWIAANAPKIRARGWINGLLVAAVALVVAEGVIVVSGLGLLGLFRPLLAAQFWRVPVLFAFFLPVIVFASLLTYIVSTTWETRGVSPVSPA